MPLYNSVENRLKQLRLNFLNLLKLLPIKLGEIRLLKKKGQPIGQVFGFECHIGLSDDQAFDDHIDIPQAVRS